MNNTQFDVTQMDLIEIERRARAMQSQVLVDMFRAARTAIAARFHRAPTSHSA